MDKLDALVAGRCRTFLEIKLRAHGNTENEDPHTLSAGHKSLEHDIGVYPEHFCGMCAA